MKQRFLFLMALLVFVSVWCRAEESHALLFSADGPMPPETAAFLTRSGDRLAVKTETAWVIRACPSTLNEIRGSGLPVAIIDSKQAAEAFIADHPEFSWVVHLFPEPVFAPSEDQGLFMEMTAPAGVTEDHEHEIRSLMKSGSAMDINPNITSDILVGSTVVAVFYVNHQLQGIPNWTPDLVGKTHANIMLNLAWWSDQANAYGKEKTFTVKSFWPDDPVCAISFDPTEGAQVNYSANDSKIANAVLMNLGYRDGTSHTAKMRAYCNDLRAEESTDWAYITYLLTGAYSVRAHASFGGPSTVLTASSASAGFTFAHETGHIFNAFDEYFEEGRSLSRSRQSRFGIPNGNHRFRNHPIMPSMMSGSFRGLSGYTAAHLGLIDSLRLFRISVSPPNAIYEVGYIPMGGSDSDAGVFSRYQGDLAFAWGNGMRVVLRGLTEISHEGQAYINPSWDGGGEEVIYAITDTTKEEISLHYSPSGTSRNLSMEYLTVKNALASELVRDIAVAGDRKAFFSGDKGISYWDNGNMTLLDYPISSVGGIPGRDTVYRISHSIVGGGEGVWHFSSQRGEVLTLTEEGLNNDLRGPNRSLLYYIVAANDEGEVFASDGGIVGGREMQGSGLHHFVNNRVEIYNSANSALPGNNISALAAGSQKSVWLGYSGTDPNPRGLFLFNPDTNTLDDHTEDVTFPLVVRLRRIGPDSLLVISRNLNPGAGREIQSAVDLVTPGSVKSYHPDLFNEFGRINDAALLPDGRLVVATTRGVGIEHTDREHFVHLTRGNSELISDNCFSAATFPDGSLVVGTSEGAVIVSGVKGSITYSYPEVTTTVADLYLFPNYPNPFSTSTTIEWHSGRSGPAKIEIYDVTGRKVETVVNEYFISGRHRVNFSAERLPPGIYYYHLQMENYKTSRKMVIMK